MLHAVCGHELGEQHESDVGARECDEMLVVVVVEAVGYVAEVAAMLRVVLVAHVVEEDVERAAVDLEVGWQGGEATAITKTKLKYFFDNNF